MRMTRWTVSVAGSLVIAAGASIGSLGAAHAQALTWSIPRAMSLPPAPASASAQAGRSQATVTWVPVPSSADQYPITGYLVTALLAGGATGPTCTAAATANSCVVTGIGGTVTFTVQATSDGGVGPAATTSQVLVTNQDPPPSPVSVTAKAGRNPGEAVVSWKPGKPSASQSTAIWHLVTAVVQGANAPGGDLGCSYVDVPATTCTVTGLSPGATYRFSVVAGSASGESVGKESPSLRIKPISIPGTVQVVMCAGSEMEEEPVRTVRPQQVILDCDAYGPQYGAPQVRRADQITWSNWTKSTALGQGTLHWPTGTPCQAGVPAANCGVSYVDYPVTIRLANPQPLNKARTTYAFTAVGLFPSGTGPAGCESSCWTIPPRTAYQ